jgi:hypothetical protein
MAPGCSPRDDPTVLHHDRTEWFADAVAQRTLGERDCPPQEVLVGHVATAAHARSRIRA